MSELSGIREQELSGTEDDENEFSFSGYENDDVEEEDALTVAARLGCMLLENKADLEAKIEELHAAIEEHKSEAEELRASAREYAVVCFTTVRFLIEIILIEIIVSKIVGSVH
jgi:hypothetical protein